MAAVQGSSAIASRHKPAQRRHLRRRARPRGETDTAVTVGDGAARHPSPIRCAALK
jgi:hypothetical protein